MKKSDLRAWDKYAIRDMRVQDLFGSECYFLHPSTGRFRKGKIYRISTDKVVLSYGKGMITGWLKWEQIYSCTKK